MEKFTPMVETIGKLIDGIGVFVVMLGLGVAVVRFFATLHKAPDPYRQFRQDIGRGILLGLEFLVAADIIRTVAVEPTLSGVLILGLIVLIRTFLSMALEVELEGRWPWQPKAEQTADAPSSTTKT